VKPSVYLDTNIISLLHYRGGDVRSIARQISTEEWWTSERKLFRVYGSKALEDELVAGSFPTQTVAIAEARKLPYLPYRLEVNECIQACMNSSVVPKSKLGDARQLAYSIIHRIDYLLTWNHAHLANVDTQSKLEVLCHKNHWRMPLIVTPDSIPKAALGQSLRRRDEKV
jgi:hypothetical protein